MGPLLALLALPGLLSAQVANPDFEEGKDGDPPPGWLVPRAFADEGFEARLRGLNPSSGKLCAVLSRDVSDHPRTIGNLMQAVKAEALRGKRIRLRADVRVTQAFSDAKAQLWLRVDRPGGKPGFFDNMHDRPVTSGKWSECEITGDVAADAEQIALGLMLIGRGAAWIDNVRLDVLADAGIGDEPPRPLSGRALENLVAFARLYGVVRWFHPSDEAFRADWDELAIEGVRLVEDAPHAKACAKTLAGLLLPAARLLVVSAERDPAPSKLDALAGAQGETREVVAWKHAGLGSKDSQSIYRSRRVREHVRDSVLPDGFADPRVPLKLDLGGGVTALVPLSVFADARGTLPRADAPEPLPRKPRPAAFRPSGSDRATRLAGVVIAWNVLEHFYPYFDVVKADWGRALEDALRQAAEDKGADELTKTLRRMVAKLRDGHGSVHLPGQVHGAPPPIAWDWVEERLVITHVKEGTGKVQRGDVVVAVNGVPAAEAVAREESLISGSTPQHLRWAALAALLYSHDDGPFVLEVERSGKKERIELEKSGDGVQVAEPRPASFTELRPGILYIDLGTLDYPAFRAQLEKLEAARGIVLDLRGYPSFGPWDCLGHFTDTQLRSPLWNVPVLRRPGRQSLEFETSDWALKPRKPRLRAKLAFITDGRAISAAETFLGIVEHYKLGAIVGGPTAGTNGNINQLVLPGGYQVVWTGMKVLKRDGSRHHGVGIQPTVPVKRTIQAVTEGRDELLERAIGVVGE